MLTVTLVGSALANPPLFGQSPPATPRVGAPIVFFVVSGNAPAAVPRLDTGGPVGTAAGALPEGPVFTVSPRGSETWRARTEVARPGRFVPVDALPDALVPVPVAPTLDGPGPWVIPAPTDAG